MELTKQELETLKLLVRKELENVKKEGSEIIVVNSPFLNKEAQDDSDLEFLKSGAKYKQFLDALLQKL